VPMHRLATWAIVGAVGFVGVAAAVDGVRDPRGPPERPAGEATPAGLGDEAAALREAGIGGTLYYIDAACRLAALRLPDLVRVEITTLTSCRRGLSRSGRWTPFGPAWQPRGDPLARCSRDAIDVFNRGTPLLGERGCALAARPDGTLTQVRDGELVEFPRDRDGRVLLSLKDLARALREVDVETGGAAFLKDIAWLDDDRFAAIVRARPADWAQPVEFVFVARAQTPVSRPSYFSDRLADLEASPLGDYLAVRTGRGARDLVVLDDSGHATGLFFSDAAAIAWSPDGAWTVVAAADRLLFFRTEQGSTRFLEIPVEARDLAWR
jgi:hypothetical protein